MSPDGRSIGAVATGAILWAVLWVGGTAAVGAVAPELLPAGTRVEHTGVLAGLVAYSVLLSVLAGFTTAAVSRPGRGVRNVAWLAGLQLALGVMIEASAWQLTPVWYHAVFLALLVPATLFGGHLRARGERHVAGARAA